MSAQLNALRGDSSRSLQQLQTDLASAKEHIVGQEKQLKDLQAQLADQKAAVSQKASQLALLEKQRTSVQSDLRSLRDQLQQVTSPGSENGTQAVASPNVATPTSAPPATQTARAKAEDDDWDDNAFVSAPPVSASSSSGPLISKKPPVLQNLVDTTEPLSTSSSSSSLGRTGTASTPTFAKSATAANPLDTSAVAWMGMLNLTEGEARALAGADDVSIDDTKISAAGDDDDDVDDIVQNHAILFFLIHCL